MGNIALALSDIIVSLVLSLNWKEVLVVNDNTFAALHTLKKLNTEGVLTATVNNDSIMCNCYQWPDMNHPDYNFDGYLLLTSISKINGDYNQFKSMVHMLQDIIIDIWTLISIGNQSVQFQKAGNWTAGKDLKLFAPLFPPPFEIFHGRVLRISTLGSPPIVERPKPGEVQWRGYMFRIINVLGDTLNFTYTVKEAEGKLYGIEQKDGSWSGMIGELMRKEVDIAVGDLSWSPDRSLVVDFTNAVFPEAVTFIYKTPGFYSRAWILFESISSGIWVCLVLSFLFSTSAFFLILLWEGLPKNIVRGKRKRKKLSKRSNFNNVAKTSTFAVDTFYRVLVTQGCPKLPTGSFSRWVLGIWLIGCMVLKALYAGTLTSSLSSHRTPRPANNLGQLLRWHPNAKLAVRNNSFPHHFFEHSESTRKNVWEKNMADNIIPAGVYLDDILAFVKSSPVDQPYVWVAERSMLERRMREASTDSAVCEFYVGQEGIVRSDWAFALVKHSPFLKKFNEKIQRMRYYGLIDHWRRKHWELENETCQPSDGLNSAGQDTPISLGDMLSLFLLLAMGLSLSMLTLVCEQITWRYKRIRKQKRK